jgi:hypothetical protein
MRVKTMIFTVFCDRAPFMRTVRCRTVANTLFNWIGRSQVIPVLGREVVERQQCFFILGQAGDGRRVFDAVFFLEDVNSYSRRGLGFNVMDLLQVGFDRRRIATGGKIATLPAAIFLLPGLDQTGGHAGRQVRGLWAKKGYQRLLEVAHRAAPQVKDRQQNVEATRPARPFGQDVRTEANFP